MAQSFVNFHTHSFYSVLQSLMAPVDVLNRAEELACPAVALTDRGVGYGLIDFVEKSNKMENKVKPLLGAEIFISQDSHFEKRAGIDGYEGYVVLIAQNQTGYENLLQLISKGHLEGLFQVPRVDWATLEQYSEGLLCLSGGVKGVIGREFTERQNPEKAELFMTRLVGLFGKERFFLELCARPGETTRQLNTWKYAQAKKFEIDILVASDAHFTRPEDEEATKTLTCIGLNQSIHDIQPAAVRIGNWFRSWGEMTELLEFVTPEDLEAARERSLDLATSIDFAPEFGQNLLPEFAVTDADDEAGQLRFNCEKGLQEKFGGTNYNEAEYNERLDYELSVIERMGFSAYFLIVEDFIQFAKDNGIAVGPGRGSAAGSLVAYLLGITNIDPIEYELLFERFLNPERVSMPDIDIDFSDERREEVMNYVTEKYGTEKVSKVCTFGTLAAKAALKDVGRAHGVEFARMNALTKMLPNKPGFSLDDAKEVTEFQDYLKKNPDLQKIFDVAYRLEGCVRHVSVHACAVIIGKDSLEQNTPIQWAPGTEVVKITQYPYQQLEHLGLLKMDFLGLKNLSILEKAVIHIEQSTGDKIDLNTIPIDDAKTFQMMADGETTGVFQFESAGMRRYLKELKPTEFEDLVAMNALYRPGPMEYIPQYIQGKHDNSTVKYMHDDLEPILNKTYGIAVYQEQVLRIARDFAGFSLGQADILRKAIGKKIASILAEQREKFIKGAVDNGYDKKLAAKLFDDIVIPFSGYGFNRSHAVCYARIAYETAYLRANYPVEFMAAMMTTDRNNTERIVMAMGECQDMEIEVLPPSLNDSGSYFTITQSEVDPNQTEIMSAQ